MREAADENSAVGKSVRRARQMRNAQLLGSLLPLAAITVATGMWLAPLSWSGLIIGAIYACLAFASGFAIYMVTTRHQPRDSREVTVWTVLLMGVLYEALRLASVALLHADFDEAVWLALGSIMADALPGYAVGVLSIVVSHTAPVTDAVLLRFPVVKTLAGTVSSVLAAVGFTLLLAWSPWLVFATIPAEMARLWLDQKRGSLGVMAQLGVLAIGGTATFTGVALFGLFR